MRTARFSSVVLALVALYAGGCLEDDEPSDMMTGPVTGQFGGLPTFDGSAPGVGPVVDAGGPINPTGGGTFGGGTFGGGTFGGGTFGGGTGGPRTDASMGNPSDAGVSSDARVSDATVPSDSSVPSEAGAGAGGWSPCPGGGMPCKIVPLGDSITVGLGYAGGYRVELFRQARLANQNITFVGSAPAGNGPNGPTMVEGATFPRVHEGRSGATISQIAGLVPSPALNMKPNIVLVMAGTNDVNLSQDLPNAPRRLGALIDKLVGADANMLIVVAQITPLMGFFGDRTAEVQALNGGLPDVVASRASAGKHVVLVDMFTGFPSGGLGDGVHPNKQGYDWMAGVWYKAISPYLR